MNDFGKKIKNKRKILGLTQKELGDAVGISRVTVSLIECSKVKNSYPRTVKLLLNYLFSKEEIEDSKFNVLIKETEYEYEGQIIQGLKNFINSQEFILMRVTDEELEHLKSYRFRDKKPTKQFYIDALFRYRNLEEK